MHGTQLPRCSKVYFVNASINYTTNMSNSIYWCMLRVIKRRNRLSAKMKIQARVVRLTYEVNRNEKKGTSELQAWCDARRDMYSSVVTQMGRHVKQTGFNIFLHHQAKKIKRIWPHTQGLT